MKKILALLLCVLMLLSTLALVACGGDDPKETKDSGKETKDSSDTSDSGKNTGDSNDTQASKYLDDLPESYSYDETINFLVNNGSYIIDGYKEGDGEFQSTDPVQKAIFQRWTEIEQRFNVTFDGKFNCDYKEVGQLLPVDVEAGSNDFDIIQGHMKFNAGLAVTEKRNTYNLQKMPNLNLEKDYWIPDYTAKFTYKKNTYWLTGDVSTSYLYNLVAMYVSNKIWAETFPDPNDPEGLMTSLFTLVDNGEWTLDEVYERTQAAYSTGDDGERGTADDVIGWIAGGGWLNSAVMHAAGYNYTVKDGKTRYKLDLCSAENDVIFSAMRKAYSNNSTVFDESNLGGISSDNLFMGNQALFYHQSIDKVSGPLRNMADPGYSVVPMPKLNKEDPYRTPSYDGIGITSVSYSVTNGSENHLNAVGAVLEALGAAGKKYLTPAVFEIALKAKSTKNEGSYRCMDIVRETGYSDFAFCWTGPLNQIDLFLANNWKEASLGVVANQQSKYEDLLDNLYYIFDNMKD